MERPLHADGGSFSSGPARILILPEDLGQGRTAPISGLIPNKWIDSRSTHDGHEWCFYFQVYLVTLVCGTMFWTSEANKNLGCETMFWASVSKAGGFTKKCR